MNEFKIPNVPAHSFSASNFADLHLRLDYLRLLFQSLLGRALHYSAESRQKHLQ